MKNKTLCILRSYNVTVTKHNFDIFEKAFSETGFDVTNVLESEFDFKNCGDYDYYLTSVITSALKLSLHKKKVLLWMQGIAPEESLMEHGNKLKYIVWNYLEKKALKKSTFVWTVSRHMILHYEKKYKLDLSEKSGILPCYNTELYKEGFYAPGKYDNNVFVYAGGLTVWQCFDKMLDTYKKIEEKNPSVSLLLLARDKEKASEAILKRGIKNFSIDYVSTDVLPNELAKAKFGFIIRDESPVNKVATPTKISSYLSCGVIPIYTSAIGDFSDIAESMEYCLKYDGKDFYEKTREMTDRKINPDDVYNEYKKIFDCYFSDEENVSHIKEKIKNICSVD